MKTFKKRFNNKSVEDWGAEMSKEAKSFVTCFRNMLKRELSPYGIEIINFKPNHYDCSGFLKKDDKYLYINYNIPRYGAIIKFDVGNCHNGVLIRTAENEKDYRGGTNNFCSIEEIPKTVLRLFKMKE